MAILTNTSFFVVFPFPKRCLNFEYDDINRRTCLSSHLSSDVWLSALTFSGETTSGVKSCSACPKAKAQISSPRIPSDSDEKEQCYARTLNIAGNSTRIALNALKKEANIFYLGTWKCGNDGLTYTVSAMVADENMHVAQW